MMAMNLPAVAPRQAQCAVGSVGIGVSFAEVTLLATETMVATNRRKVD